MGLLELTEPLQSLTVLRNLVPKAVFLKDVLTQKKEEEEEGEEKKIAAATTRITSIDFFSILVLKRSFFGCFSRGPPRG